MSRILSSFSSALCLCAAVLALTSCASTRGGSRADGGGTRAQFVDNAWVTPALKGRATSELYREVMFRQVSTGPLRQMGWWAAQSSKTQSELERDAVQLGRYMKRSFERAVANHPGGGFRVVQTPSSGTLVIDLSITELVPAKKFWNAAATGAGFVVPGAGLLSAAGKGSIGIEGRVYDGFTAELLAGFKDRRADRTAVVNTAQYSWYRGSEKNIDDLARSTAAFLNAPQGAVITRSRAPELFSR